MGDGGSGTLVFFAVLFAVVVVLALVLRNVRRTRRPALADRDVPGQAKPPSGLLPAVEGDGVDGRVVALVLAGLGLLYLLYVVGASLLQGG